MNHFELLKKSFIELKNNFKIITPDLIMLGMNLVFALVFLLINGDLFSKIISDPGILFNAGSGGITRLLDIIKLHNNTLKVIISFAGFLFVNFLFGAGLVAVKYRAVKDLVQTRKVSLTRCFKLAGKDVFRVLQIRVFVFLLISGVTLLLKFIFDGFVNFYTSAYILLSLYLLLEISLFLVNLFLLFRYPILFIDDTSGLRAVKNAFLLTIRKWRFVLVVWFFIFFITTLVTLFFSGIIGYLAYLARTTLGLAILTIGFYLIRSLFSLSIKLWLDIYLFRAYIKGK